LKVRGLEGISGWDQLTTTDITGSDVISFEKNVDTIYKNTEKQITISSDLGSLVLHRKDLPDVVVWNPWSEKAKAMSDFDDDGFKRMVCVEPGFVAERKSLQPNQQWTGSQWLVAE